MQINLPSPLPPRQSPRRCLPLIHEISGRPPLTSRASHPGLPSAHSGSLDRSNISSIISRLLLLLLVVVVLVSSSRAFQHSSCRWSYSPLLPLRSPGLPLRVGLPRPRAFIMNAAFPSGHHTRTVSDSLSYSFYLSVYLSYIYILLSLTVISSLLHQRPEHNYHARP